MRTGERREHEPASIGVARMYGQPVAVLGHGDQRVDVGDLQFGIHALSQQVALGRHDVDVLTSGALVEVFPGWSLRSTTIDAVYRAERGRSRNVRAFVDHMIGYLSERDLKV